MTEEKSNLDFNITGDEMLLIDKIVKRYMELSLIHKDHIAYLEHMMDLALCHQMNYKLNFTQLLLTSDSDLMHTVKSIEKAMDRTTGKFRDGFVPNHVVKA